MASRYTTIGLLPSTKVMLENIGHMGETFDELIRRIIEENEGKGRSRSSQLNTQRT